MMQITYQKRNGCVFQKIRKTMLPYKIGETTSMGWKVLNIEYQYKDEFYPEYEYMMIISKEKEKYLKKQQLKELFINESKALFYYFIVVLIINLIKIILG